MQRELAELRKLRDVYGGGPLAMAQHGAQGLYQSQHPGDTQMLGHNDGGGLFISGMSGRALSVHAADQDLDDLKQDEVEPRGGFEYQSNGRQSLARGENMSDANYNLGGRQGLELDSIGGEDFDFDVDVEDQATDGLSKSTSSAR